MRIGIIGTGLIGGSLALSLKKAGKQYKVYCWNRRREISLKAVENKICDGYFDTVEELTEQSDVIIVATPLGSYEQVFRKIALSMTSEKIITDVGSVKFLPISHAVAQLPRKLQNNFVPAHPIAGKEKGGLQSADAELFKRKTVIITPLKNRLSDIKKIKALWFDAGAKPVVLDIKKHDEIYAYVSHYVQFLSFALKKHFPHRTGEFTRLMNSPADIWQEIFSYNRQNLKKIHTLYLKSLDSEIQRFKISESLVSDNLKEIMLAYALKKIIPADYIKYAGTGYKSFTSILSDTTNNKLPDTVIKAELEDIYNELKKIKI